MDAVCVDCNRVIRRTLSHELKDTRDSFNGTWVVCGDFNITSFPSERTNCTRISGVMTEFSSCIEESELVDPPFIWRIFYLEKRGRS